MDAKEHYNKGLQFSQAKSWEEAIKEFNEALKVEPYSKSGLAHYNLATCYYNKGLRDKEAGLGEGENIKEAIYYYRRAETLNPKLKAYGEVIF